MVDYHELHMAHPGKRTLVYDDAAYHQGAPVFSPQTLNPNNSATHIGMYLAWIILSRFESFALRQLAPTEVEQVRNKEMTGREFLLAHCAGRLTSDALNKEAQIFTEHYYEDQFLHDYDEVLVVHAGGTYAVLDSWANYDRLAAVIDKRLREYRGARPATA